VFGWANLWVIKPTVIASIVSVFALYFCQAVGLPDTLRYGVGVAAILLLTFVNWLGVREGAGTQSVLTTIKVVGILACARRRSCCRARPPRRRRPRAPGRRPARRSWPASSSP